MTSEVEINSEFRQALEIIDKSDAHLFITGKAGTGKSTLLDYCYRHCPKDLVIIAPTGVAALNVKGQTIHRFFNFPINVTVSKIENLEVRPRSLGIFRHLQTIFIDEVSMLRADLLDCINAFLKIYGPQPNKTFGGVQMVFVGDMYQLPPVVGKEEAEIFESEYRSPYFFDAKVFSEIELKIVELQHIYRQKDKDFIELLNRIRSNQARTEDIIKLNSHIKSRDQAERTKGFSISFTPTNQQADTINSQRLAELSSPLHRATAEIEGVFTKEYYPTQEILEFKVGSQIMFLNNDAKNRWVNGTVGKIEDISQDAQGTNLVKIRLNENQKLVRVQPYTWEIFRYKKEGEHITSESVGSFTQFPFRLAWAITIHKSQGKTFSHIEIDMGRGAFSAGQLYVALSRCTSLDGIELTRPIKAKDILTDFRIIEFLNRYKDLDKQEDLSHFNKISLLQEGIRRKSKLEILYQKQNGSQSKRFIIGQSIRGENLLAYCLERNELRSFNIERIKGIKERKE